MEQMRRVREEKRRLRRAVRETESDALRLHGGGNTNSNSSGNNVASDAHWEPIHAQYRHARAKLRLLEALVAKHDGSATL